MTAQQTLFETADPDRKPRPARQTAGQVKAVARSLDRLRRSGYVAEVVERFVTFGGPTDVQKTVDDLLRDRGALIAFLESTARAASATARTCSASSTSWPSSRTSRASWRSKRPAAPRSPRTWRSTSKTTTPATSSSDGLPPAAAGLKSTVGRSG